MSRDDFLPLEPGPDRKVGVEIEFAGLDEGQAADVAAQVLGGTPEPSGAQSCTVTGTSLGRLEIYLDTALRGEPDNALEEAGLALGRTLVPVEIVTQPLSQSDLPQIDALRAALKEAGAVGTEASAVYGFGLHLNVEMPSDDVADIAAITLAYALAEPWLRRGGQIDITRHILPFTQPYPPAFTRALGDADIRGWPDLFDLYIRHNATRNRGLDLLPILGHMMPEDLDARLGADHGVSARPAFHYRLPDSRVGDPGWSIANEWNRWVRVERLARDPQAMRRLSEAFSRTGPPPARSDATYLAHVDTALQEHFA